MFAADSSSRVTYSLYRDLEIRPPCSVEDINRAYKKLALKYHPDKATGSTEKFQKVKRAHEILKDPLKKEFYDKFGDNNLHMITPEASVSNFKVGTDGLISRTILKIMIRPTLLVPIFLAIAFIGVTFVTFLSRLDQKLYFSKYTDIPWYKIFSLLWIVVVVGFLFEVLYLYSVLRNSKIFVEKMFESDEYQGISESKKRFLIIAHAMKEIISAFRLFITTILFLFCTVLLALNMDNKGSLLNGLTWTKLIFPVIYFIICFGIVENLLRLACVLRYNQPNRMWKQRILVVSNGLYATFSSIFFFHHLGAWLDSSEKSHVRLFMIFSLVYLRILFNGFRIRCEFIWNSEDEIKKFLERNPSSNPQSEFERKIKQHRKNTLIFIGVTICIIGISIALVHSHIGCQWPKTWSAALFPIMLCVYISIFVFGCFCPCTIFCMELASPPNSFNTFAFDLATREELVTIIEISSFYRFGYGLAPFQRRITYPTRYY